MAAESESKMADTPAQAAARAWLHSYGIDTGGYLRSGIDHPAMGTLPAAFEEYAKELRSRLDEFRSYGCPVCSGDCASANPPVILCPMRTY